MKTIILGVVAVVAGLGLGAYAGGLKEKNALLVIHADSVAAADSIAALAAAASEPPVATPGGRSDSAPSEPPPSAADFAAQDEGGTETTAAPEEPDESSETVEDSTDPAEAGAETPANPMALAQPPADVPNADSIAAAELLRAEGARKLSRIFAVMDARDAANVLQQLGNDEIESILRYMSERNAAPILELFEPARAAELSRVLLSGGSRR